MRSKVVSKVRCSPLMSWDISNPALSIFSRKAADLDLLTDLSEENNWQVDFSKELAISYQALVLTDVKQTILWVNDGFQPMTGYSPNYAIGKKPAFLQGTKTSGLVREKIREQLRSGSRVSETITNYKKNGQPYDCLITIIPLFDSNQVITHYLALEREAA